MAKQNRIDLVDLARVVYTSGKVFDGLRTGRLDTEDFLRSGSTAGVSSRADLALLEDLRDSAQFVIDNAGRPVDADYVRGINAAMTRSAAISPGRLRTADQRIGVNTRHGRHEPPAVSAGELEQIIRRACVTGTAEEQSLELFVELAKAQPFTDGNKRTALLAANGLLLGSGATRLLVVPLDEKNPGVADRFNDLLALAYLHDDTAGVKAMLREKGLVRLRGPERPSQAAPAHPQASEVYARFPELRRGKGESPADRQGPELDR